MMKKSTFWSLVVLAALGLALLCLDSYLTRPTRAIAGLLLPGFRPEEVTAVRIERPDEIVLRRQDRAWRLERPLAAPADAEVVLHLLDTLRKSARRGVAEGAPEDYGMTPPKVVLTVTRPSGTTTLTFGRRTLGPEGPAGSVFLRIDDSSEIIVGPAQLLRVCGLPVETFRDRTVWRWDPSRARRLEIDRTVGPAQGRFVLSSGDGELWILNRPVGSDAVNQDRVHQLLRALAHLRAERFVTIPTVPPTIRVAIGSEGEAEPRRLFFAASDEVWMAWPAGGQEAYVVKRELIEPLQAELLSLRPPGLVFRLVEIESVTVLSGDGPIIAKVAADQADPKAQAWLETLSRLAASHYLDYKPTPEQLRAFGLEPEGFRLVIRFRPTRTGRRAPTALVIGRALPEGRAAKLDRAEPVFCLPHDQVRRILAGVPDSP